MRWITSIACLDIRLFCVLPALAVVFPGRPLYAGANDDAHPHWRIGTPIVTWYAGPAMSDAAAQQMADAGFNVVWCEEKDLDLVAAHGLRAMLRDNLLSQSTLDDPAKTAQLDALIDRVKDHPAMYSYYIIDEPPASMFPALGKLTAHLDQRDPAHFPYINLFPTYASNEQLGTAGDVVTAYNEHLRQFIEIVRPKLISYDHYQFFVNDRDGEQYFLNLSLIREAAQKAGVPFLNIVQAASWDPSVRVPNADETRYLVYTTLAYGAQGISYYVYQAANHKGGIANEDGTPTPIYDALKTLNREFVAIASELQPLRSQAIYHTSMKEAGCVPLSADNPPFIVSGQANPDRGVMLGYFGKERGKARHVLIVNLDYRSAADVKILKSEPSETFDPATKQWSPMPRGGPLHLPPGGGVLLRLSTH